jgi:catechol 2,3-dioxygenase-like lactoylglutathione lyase family enzyme
LKPLAERANWTQGASWRMIGAQRAAKDRHVSRRGNERTVVVDTQEEDSQAPSWPSGIGAITLFVEDLEAASRFYQEVFGLPIAFEDDNSAVFNFGNTLVNLLKVTAAPELIQPAVVAPRDAGSRLQFTIEVDDVDAMCAELVERGVELLNGPVDRPWGIRTASFRDPGGHIWEIAH